MKYARIRPPHPTQYYRSELIQFVKRDWTSFDEIANPAIVTDPHLEVVDTIPDIVDDAQATSEELRTALRAERVELEDMRDRLRRSADLVGTLEIEIATLREHAAAPAAEMETT